MNTNLSGKVWNGERYVSYCPSQNAREIGLGFPAEIYLDRDTQTRAVRVDLEAGTMTVLVDEDAAGQPVTETWKISMFAPASYFKPNKAK